MRRIKEFGSFVSSVRSYEKATFVADVGTLAILACETSLFNVHDVKHVPNILEKLAHDDVSIKYMLADKGYDSEDVHLHIRDKLDTKAVFRRDGWIRRPSAEGGIRPGARTEEEWRTHSRMNSTDSGPRLKGEFDDQTEHERRHLRTQRACEEHGGTV